MQKREDKPRVTRIYSLSEAEFLSEYFKNKRKEVKMILNEFSIEAVKAVFEEIKDIPDIIFMDSISVDLQEIEGFVFISYDFVLHKFYIQPITEKPLYPNESYVCELVPREIFIERIKGNRSFVGAGE